MRNCLILFLLLTVFSSSFGQKKFLVVASTSIIYDMAQNIAPEGMELVSLLPVGSDPHLHDPTPEDVRLLSKADLILINGLTLEGWLQKMMANSGSKAPMILTTEGITPITSSQHAGSSDPHAWMDPINAQQYVRNISKAFIQSLPEKKSEIETKTENYLSQLSALNLLVKSQMDSIPLGKRVLITSHDAFHYFGKRYGVEVQSLLGTSTDADVQVQDFARLGKLIQERKIPAIFTESTINPKVLNQIAADNSTKIGGKLFSDSLGDKNSGAGTYIEMIEHNSRTILLGLSGNRNSSDESKSSSKWLLWLVGIGFILGLVFYFFKK
jgi:ABC-type Zn uptake system ZnuABC Zn-binding protein ZnuA